jgi:DNA polymerase-3 subunit alpha
MAETRLRFLHRTFGDRLYVELQRHGADRERMIEDGLVELAYAHGLPLVATNEPYFAARSDYEAHDALLAIADGRLVSDPNRRQLTTEHYFRSRAEMIELFSDLPEAIASTVEIAMRCAFRPRTRKPILPRFTASPDPGSEDDELTRQAEEGLARRLAVHGTAPGLSEDVYRERLAFELGVIRKMAYSGYFLIVSDFIKWAKDRGIPVGPGRGSGAGSLVAWALTITDLDPLRFGLLFERFLNPERVSMPDFDIDFCMDRREEVIRYVQARYGQDRVAQIITFGTLLARGVMRDVGRVLEMPYGQVDKLTKLVPQNPANPVTLAKAIEGEAKLREAAEAEPVVRRMLDIALKLEGLHRHASTHAAGIVIGDRPLEELVPLYRDPRSDMPVTQFNMKWVEQAGLVKFDFLGLRTLTVLQTAVDLVGRRGIEVDLSAIPLDDAHTYAMLGRGETVGVFQLESAGMRKALVDMRADRFEDIIALVALYRPGPMANIPTYCLRKHGLEAPDHIHPKLEPVLKETFGVIIYQEQVMQIAQLLSGYSLGEADLLRRAMGKKIKAEMDAQRDRFVSGAVARGIERARADTIFDLLAKFADYGFNKSHAAAYALVAYQTAYMKANFPVEFIAASMTHEMANTDKLAEFRREAARLGITVEPPSVMRSGVWFDVHEGAIRYALAALKGVGPQAVAALVEARGEAPFRDLGDVARRLNPRLVNKRTLEALAFAGAFDDLDRDRARVHALIDQMMALAQRRQGEEAAGQSDIFGGVAAEPEPLRPARFEPWTQADRLQKEFDAIGFFLSGHPLDEYAPLLKRLNVQRFVDFVRAVKEGGSMARIAATVLDRAERRTKSGNKMGVVMLSDQTAQFEAILFSEGLARYRDLLEPGARVVCMVRGSLEGEEVRVRIETVEQLDAAAAGLQSSLRIFLRDDAPISSIRERLRERGEGEVSIVVAIENGGREVEVKLPGRFRTSPQIAGALKAIPGVVTVEHA